jgi:hypothetical protein
LQAAPSYRAQWFFALLAKLQARAEPTPLTTTQTVIFRGLTLLWGKLSSASENYFFLLNGLLFVFLSLCFLPLMFGSSPLVERRSLDWA